MKTHKVLALFLSCLILFPASPAQGQSQAPVSTSAQDARVERLAGLAKVWGAVKYFHPYLAYRELDWDKALVETLQFQVATTCATPTENSYRELEFSRRSESRQRFAEQWRDATRFWSERSSTWQRS
jgi:hypothetical protein